MPARLPGGHAADIRGSADAKAPGRPGSRERPHTAAEAPCPRHPGAHGRDHGQHRYAQEGPQADTHARRHTPYRKLPVFFI